MLLAGGFIHIERAVQFDLDAVPVRCWIAIAAHQIATAIWVVDLHTKAQCAQCVGHPRSERRISAGAAAIAHDRIRAQRAVVFVHGVAARLHRMAVDVPDMAELLPRTVERRFQCRAIRQVVVVDARTYLSQRERRVIHRHAGQRKPADQPHAARGVRLRL